MKDRDNSYSREPTAGELSVQQAGQRSGRSTLKRHGVGHFRKIGRKGGQSTKTRYQELMQEFGRRGGRPKRPALSD